MLPSSSSSQLPSYGTINQYKRFSWLMQSQIEKQADLNATTLSLGIASSHGNIPSSMMKESKPTQLMKESKQWNISSSRADIVSANRVLAMAAEAPASLNYCASADSPLCSHLMMNGVPAPSLSLAMQCESALECDPNFGIPNWAVTISPYQYGQGSEMNCKGVHGVNVFLHPELFRPSNLQRPADSIADCESSVSSTAQNPKGQRPAVWEPNHTIENPLNELDLTIACAGVQVHPCDVQSDNPAMVIGRDDPAGSSKNLLSSSYGGFRTCTVCGTSKTPLWRSGPNGPKSLCNACGIRMKKSKRLQAEVDTGTAAASSAAKAFKRCASSSKVMGDRTLPLKRKLSMEAAEITGEPMNQKQRKAVPRRARIWAPPNLDSAGGHKQIDRWAKLAAGLVGSTSPTAKRSGVLAKVDELEEAAVLLMALSRGLSLS